MLSLSLPAYQVKLDWLPKGPCIALMYIHVALLVEHLPTKKFVDGSNLN